MADVDTWSPLDESNTAAPPDGWPEFMLPSGVNNSARAMMGAIRRWYDKQLSGDLVLPYLKLNGGGTVTGGVTVSGAFTANAISSSTTIYAISTISTSGGLSASGNITGANITASALIQGANITSTNNINATNDIGARDLFFRNGSASGSTNTSGNITAGGTVDGGSLNSRGGGNIAGLLNTGSLGVFSNVQVNGSINTNGNITVGGSVTAAYISSSGDIQLNGTLRGNGPNLPIASHIYPSSDGGTYCGLAAFAWAGVDSYVYYTKSDERLKTGIRDLPDCLDLVRQIQPKRYRLKDVSDDTREHYGFIAREVGKIMGADFAGYRAAKTDDERDALAYDELISVLWRAVQALDARLTEGGL
jgi:Chaperone of endosialidase